MRYVKSAKIALQHVAEDAVPLAAAKTNKPVLHTAAPASVTIQTLDCFSNQLRKEDDKLQSLSIKHSNTILTFRYVRAVCAVISGLGSCLDTDMTYITFQAVSVFMTE